METVNFQCGGCGNLLAVSTEHLGQQVRCPHCQQVVLAPAPADQPPTLDTTFQMSPRDEHESIFSTKNETEDLFGHLQSPRVELPTEVLDTGPPTVVPKPENRGVPAWLSGLGGDRTLEVAPPSPPPEPPRAASPPPPWSPAGETVESGSVDLGREFGRLPVRTSRGGGWYIALFIIPLISWAILASLAAGILYYRLQAAPPHPLEFVPDINGDNPTKRSLRADAIITQPVTDMELPPHLRTRLGDKLVLGELEVTPLRVEQGFIKIGQEGKNREQPKRKALHLFLLLKNVSPDLPFFPMDTFFTRHWRSDGKQPPGGQAVRTQEPPYTQLVVGTRRFYGGPAAWSPRGGAGRRESVVGQLYDTLLQPDEELETFVCTDPEDERLDEALEKNDGATLLWRVQVRRGSVWVSGRRVPATAVFGVEFSEKQITNRGMGE